MDVMFPLRPGRLPPNQVQTIIFITRSKPSQMEIIADNVLRLVSWCYSCFEHEAIVRMKNSDSVRERERDSKFVEIIL